MSEPDAEQAAARRFGAPGPSVRHFDHFSRPLKALLVCDALATAGIALWLFAVVTTVLPAHDPAHVTLWTAFALGFLAYAAVTLAFVRARVPRLCGGHAG